MNLVRCGFIHRFPRARTSGGSNTRIPREIPHPAASSALRAPEVRERLPYFYACLDPGDENHLRAKTLAAEIASTPTSLLTTWDIVGETVTILRYRKNHHLAVRFLDEVKPQLRMVRYGDRIRKEAEQIFRRYGRDHRLSFCDAISFTVVKSLLGGMDCLSFDKDFRSLGLSVIN